MNYKPLFFFLLISLASISTSRSEHIIWQLGESNNSADEFALAPHEYKRFLEKDFGYEDRYFLIGRSQLNQDFPYILPGPSDSW